MDLWLIWFVVVMFIIFVVLTIILIKKEKYVLWTIIFIIMWITTLWRVIWVQSEINCKTKYEISKYENWYCFVELDWKFHEESLYKELIIWKNMK